MSLPKKTIRSVVAALALLSASTAQGAVALVQSMFQHADRVYTAADVLANRTSIAFPTLYGTASNTIFVMVIGGPGTCTANNSALTDLGNSIYSIVVGTGSTNNYSIHCTLSSDGNTSNAMVGVFEVSGADGTIDVATATYSSGLMDPSVSITPTITASLIVAFGWAERTDHPTNRPLLMCPNASSGTTRLAYRYFHELADSYNHQIRWFQRLDALGTLGASTLGMSGGFSSWYLVAGGTDIFNWGMTAVAIHPS